jgi:hypothetical protein
LSWLGGVVTHATWAAEPTGLRLGEGEFPPELDRVNFGAFLLGVLWAPFHRLWGWFAVFVVLEALESAMGLSSPRFLGGVFARPVTMVAFRIVYWTVTVAFALRANRLVWTEECKRGARTDGAPVRGRPFLVSRYVSNQRVWTLVGLILLAVTPLSLLVGPVNSIPGAVADVVVTVGTQAILLAGLWLYDRMRIANRQR